MRRWSHVSGVAPTPGGGCPYEAILPLLRRRDINAEHAAIHEAIRDRDPDAAAAAVDRHLDRLERLYRRAGVR